MVNTVQFGIFPLKAGQILSKSAFELLLMVMESQKNKEKFVKTLKRPEKQLKQPIKEPKMRYFKKMDEELFMKGRQIGNVFCMETEDGYDIFLADNEGKSRKLSLVVDSSVPGVGILNLAIPADMAYLLLHNPVGNYIGFAVQTADIPPQPEEMSHLHVFVRKETYGVDDGPFLLVPKSELGTKRRKRKVEKEDERAG